MINTKNFDFAQRWMVGSGTATCATADTLSEIVSFLATQDDLSRHFCKIYDRGKNRYTDGFALAYAKYGNKIEWWPW